MELNISQIDTKASKWDVTRAIAAVLHEKPAPPFFEYGGSPGRKLNFKVALNEGPSSLRNNGTGSLMVPSEEVGHKLLGWLRKPRNRICVLGKPIKLWEAKTRPSSYRIMTLEKAPYVEPDKEERLEKLEAALREELHITEVQIGTLSAGRCSQPSLRKFWIEYRDSYAQGQRLAILKFEWKTKQLCLVLGHPALERVGHQISIRFSSIAKIEVGLDWGTPFVCFELLVPPLFYEVYFNSPMPRKRVAALHERHASVSPYAHHIRVLLFDRLDPLRTFMNLCENAKGGGLRAPCRTELEVISGDPCFSPERMRRVQAWLKKLEWDAGFQMELLLHNGLVNTKDLMTHLKGPVDALCRSHGAIAGFVLRHFAQALRHPSQRLRKESVKECFDRVSQEKIHESHPTLPEAMFSCHHVTVTPTRLILEGPYAIQSNRVLREYRGFEKNFLRVDFRDEDRLPLRWARGVDESDILKERIGGILTKGLELAGRRFEFLAYSSSALRSHAVWFMTPFEHPELGQVNSHVIRERLGMFQGTKVVTQPSKLAARLALAFTATDPSVSIEEGQWVEVPDIGSNKDALHTDGCGTISPELRDRIWQTLCKSRGHGTLNAGKPDAFQIRFLGFKGVVFVNHKLEGIKMQLRPSMKKFDTSPRESAEIEIAQAFERPNACYLNRPLIMVLEDRGISAAVFQDLAAATVADARTIGDSSEHFCRILRGHDLGRGFHLASTLKCLENLGLDLTCSPDQQQFGDPFLSRARTIAMNHVLRGVKHGARIKVPDSWLLVGVADEGPAYERLGYQNVFCLNPFEIYACVQSATDEEPEWVQGRCLLYRCPVVHPGDVLLVNAIGKPPEGMLCLFADLKNVVVLPSRGDRENGNRSLASCTGGGDVDGDLFCVIRHEPLLRLRPEEPASYPPGEIFTLDRPSEVEDICNFIVEYIHSDVLGLLSMRHLIIAGNVVSDTDVTTLFLTPFIREDQSKFGTRDFLCLELAKLCSDAVDYPKNGIPVNIHACPHRLIAFDPDWHASEVPNPHDIDYYESTRALGHIYRAVRLDDLSSSASGSTPSGLPSLWDAVSGRLDTLVKPNIPQCSVLNRHSPDINSIFKGYADELEYICSTHVVSAQDRLLEEEVVIGTIMAKCTNRKWRNDRIHSMRLHASTLVHSVQRALLPEFTDLCREDLQQGLMKAWLAWDYSVHHRESFGATSFGLIALDVIFHCLKQMGISLQEGGQ